MSSQKTKPKLNVHCNGFKTMTFCAHKLSFTEWNFTFLNETHTKNQVSWLSVSVIFKLTKSTFSLWGIYANKVHCSAQLFKLYYSVLKFMCMSLSASYLCMFVCLYVSICVHFFSRMCSCLWVFRCLVGLSYRIVKWRRQMSWAIQ